MQIRGAEAAVRAEPDGASPAVDVGWELAGSAALRMMAGARLRRLREAAGITPERAGYEIRASVSKISRMETGRVSLKPRDVADLLTLYGAAEGAEREETLALAERAGAPAWWAPYSDLVPNWLEPYLGMETAASVIRSFDVQFVHGLLQTEEYARAVSLLGHPAVPEQDAARRASMRLARQELLRRADPPLMWMVLDEAALRRPVGGPSVMRGQLEQLIEAAHLPHITLRVVPFAHGGHAAAGGAFTLLRFDEPGIADTVYIEQLTTALYLTKRADVEHYLQVMNALNTQALKPYASVHFLRQILQET